jgi:Alkylmercury lyase
MSNDAFANQVRISTYQSTVRTGRVPKTAEVAAALGADLKQVRAAYERLSESHALMIDPETGELWRAAPFSAVPTGFPVRIGAIEYFGNCAWDALGIPAAMNKDAEIPTSCACCNQPITLEVSGGQLKRQEALIHIAVPARDWYKDVVFT